MAVQLTSQLHRLSCDAVGSPRELYLHVLHVNPVPSPLVLCAAVQDLQPIVDWQEDVAEHLVSLVTCSA